MVRSTSKPSRAYKQTVKCIEWQDVGWAMFVCQKPSMRD